MVKMIYYFGGLSCGFVNDLDHCSSARNCSVSIFVCACCCDVLWIVICVSMTIDLVWCMIFGAGVCTELNLILITDVTYTANLQILIFFQINRDRVCFESN